ncbi:MAG: hypothetical protein IMX00_03155 [Limnochordales bacterium]|nr:hypothetical protein [Limnochordales bacterium]
MSWVWVALFLSLAAFFAYVAWLGSRLHQIEREVALVARQQTRNRQAGAEGKE